MAEDGFVNTRDFVLSGLGGQSLPVGTHGWRVLCQALTGSNRSTTGVFTVQ